ncbi:hypothetical protein OIO90_001059 [Microbotryomycetes sp. JL221]|nr:hypothetical protein OIO90_001059 [Microbotryomycetes sp. JL221]
MPTDRHKRHTDDDFTFATLAASTSETQRKTNASQLPDRLVSPSTAAQSMTNASTEHRIQHQDPDPTQMTANDASDDEENVPQERDAEPAMTATLPSSMALPDEQDNDQNDSAVVTQDTMDWMNPQTLPRNGPFRRKRELQALEQGLFVSAIKDDIKNQLNIATTLFEWEMLRQRQIGAEQNLVQPPRLPAAAQSETRSASPDAPQNMQDLVQSSKQNQQRVTPSVAALSKMSRWPLYSQALPKLQDDLDLDESLTALVSRVRRQAKQTARNGSDPIERVRKPKPPSAYGANGPFSAWRTLYSDDADTRNNDINEENLQFDDFDPESSEEDGDLDDPALDEGIDTSIQPEPCRKLHSVLKDVYQSVLAGLVERVPLTDVPALNYYLMPHRRQEGSNSDDKVIDWTSVVKVAQRVEGISSRVVNQLRTQLEELYGPAKQDDGTDEAPATRAARGRRSRTSSVAPQGVVQRDPSTKTKGKRKERQNSMIDSVEPPLKKVRSRASSRHGSESRQASRSHTPTRSALDHSLTIEDSSIDVNDDDGLPASPQSP